MLIGPCEAICLKKHLIIAKEIEKVATNLLQISLSIIKDWGCKEG